MSKTGISKNRNYLLGIACLWIIIQHCHFETGNYLIWALGRFGFSQVDVFLFLSGFGLYYSLNKNEDYSAFYKKRFLRILPTYWIVSVAYLVFECMVASPTFLDALSTLLCISFWKGGKYNLSWYANAIVLFYFLAPFVFSAIQSAERSKAKLTGLFVLSLLISISALDSNLMMAFGRFPSFCLGMIVASLGELSKGLKRWSIAAFFAGGGCVAFIELFLGEYLSKHTGTELRLIFLPLFLLPLGECLILSTVKEKTEKLNIFRAVNQGIAFIGTLSFEIYLIQTLFNIFFEQMLRDMNQPILYNSVKIGLAALSVLAAYGVRKVVDVLIAKIYRTEQ